jgi:CheY-like chemotaxis protein
MRAEVKDAAAAVRLLEGKRICIVEDDPFQAAVVRLLLKRSEVEAVFFRSGLEALKWLQHEAVDVILVDVMLPDLDGWEVCAKIRGGGPNRTTPIIFTTCVIEREQEAVMSDPAARTLSLAKPLDRERLLGAMSTVLQY